MRYTPKQYAKALYDITIQNGEKDGVMKDVDSFIAIVKLHKKEYLLKSILKEYKLFLIRSNVLPEVSIRTAGPCSKDVYEDIFESLHISQTTRVVHDIDSTLVGGIVVKDNNHLYDLSILRSMQQLKKKMLQ